MFRLLGFAAVAAGLVVLGALASGSAKVGSAMMPEVVVKANGPEYAVPLEMPGVLVQADGPSHVVPEVQIVADGPQMVVREVRVTARRPARLLAEHDGGAGRSI